MEDKKKLGMILTIVTVLLCGCPGLCMYHRWDNSHRATPWRTTAGMSPVTRPLSPALGLQASVWVCLVILITIGAGVYWFIQSRKAKESSRMSKSLARLRDNEKADSVRELKSH